MTTVAGASRFLTTATLANSQGRPPGQSGLIESLGVVDILDIGRQDNGIGLSGRARALNKKFLNATASGFNQVFSLSTAKLGSNEVIQQEILALRSRLPENQIAESLRGDTVDETA